MMAILYSIANKLRHDLRGQDMVEYALVAGMVAVAAGAIFPTTLVPNISRIYSKMNLYIIQAASQGS
jgi:Flp pilus assembly pilin Flp